MKNKIIGIKKEVFGIDESSVCATVAYGFSNKKEAVKVIARYSGEDEKTVRESVRKVRIMRTKKDGEWFYFWGDKCSLCGHKNGGVISYVWDN